MEGSEHMRSLLIAGIFAAASISSIQAQVYPSNPITMIVPLPAGSAFDVTARLLAEHLRVSLGQPVIVENAPVRHRTATRSASAVWVRTSLTVPFWLSRTMCSRISSRSR
jgi:hypothetical protein